MPEAYRIKEHALLYKRQGRRWEFWLGLFAPGPARGRARAGQHLRQLKVETENDVEDRILQALVTEPPKDLAALAAVASATQAVVTRVLRDLDQVQLLETLREPSGLSSSELERYDRQLRLWGVFGDRYAIQRRLKESEVVIFGLGAIGGWLALSLAAAGVGSIVGYDPDVVERSNLNRQVLFTEADIGRPKAEVAAERLRALNPDIRVQAQAIEATPENVAQLIPPTARVVVSTAYPVEHWANRHCLAHNIPIVAQGGGAYSPTGVLVMLPGRTGCFDCVGSNPALDDLLRRIQDRHGPGYAPTIALGPFVSLCANLMAVEVIKIITGIHRPTHNVFIDPLHWEVHEGRFELVRRPDCPTCGRPGARPRPRPMSRARRAGRGRGAAGPARLRAALRGGRPAGPRGARRQRAEAEAVAPRAASRRRRAGTAGRGAKARA
ncbi:MAG: HesA/MoeB/ThiF family protein, partial [Acetobacteraceae bacterium]|nr:HesA/MoeB/ThiF family protein [Acetobacteraceae bacterium]